MGETQQAKTCETETVRSPGGQHRRKNVSQRATEVSIKSMLLKGISNRNIASFLGISPTTVQRVRNDIKSIGPEGDLKSGLMSPHRDENAGKLIDHFIGKGLKMRAIKGSDALGAVKMYADRRWPVRTEAAPPSRTFVQTNLNIFLPDSQPAPLAVTPTTICSVEEGGNLEKPNNLNQFDTCNVRE